MLFSKYTFSLFQAILIVKELRVSHFETQRQWKEIKIFLNGASVECGTIYFAVNSGKLKYFLLDDALLKRKQNFPHL
jgi:hypothetical protein